MRLLHTSDWHLGQTFLQFERSYLRHQISQAIARPAPEWLQCHELSLFGSFRQPTFVALTVTSSGNNPSFFAKPRGISKEIRLPPEVT